MGATAESAADQSMAGRLGLKSGQVVQEFGYDNDVDDGLRTSIEDVDRHELADEDATGRGGRRVLGGGTRTATWSTPSSTP